MACKQKRCRGDACCRRHVASAQASQDGSPLAGAVLDVWQAAYLVASAGGVGRRRLHPRRVAGR